MVAVNSICFTLKNYIAKNRSNEADTLRQISFFLFYLLPSFKHSFFNDNHPTIKWWVWLWPNMSPFSLKNYFIRTQRRIRAWLYFLIHKTICQGLRFKVTSEEGGLINLSTSQQCSLNTYKWKLLSQN